MRGFIFISSYILFCILYSSNIYAQESLTPEIKGKIDAILPSLKELSIDPTIVAEVKEYNTNPPQEAISMTQEKWKDLTIMSPEVKFFIKNKLGTYLKTKKSDLISEIFVNGENGNKVAFLSKPTNWSHKGKAKHEDPMKNKIWIGQIEVDASTGIQQVQVGLPVLDGSKPIGSIVIGLAVASLK